MLLYPLHTYRKTLNFHSMKRSSARYAVMLAALLSAIAVQAQYGRGLNNAQRPTEHSFYYRFGTPVYAEVVNLTADDPSQSRVLANFRIAYDALTFQKPVFSDETSHTFTASVTVRADLLDEHDVTVQRAQWTDTITVQSYIETNDKFEYVVGSLLFDVKPGKYALNWTVEDGATREQVREQKSNVIAQDFQHTPVSVTKPVVAALLSETTLIPRSLGGNAEFGMPITFYTEEVAPQPPSLSYELIRIKNQKAGETEKDNDSILCASGTVTAKTGVHLALQNNRCCTVSPAIAIATSTAVKVASTDTTANNRPSLSNLLTPSSMATPDTSMHAVKENRYYSTFTINGDSLEMGDYVLKLRANVGFTTDTATQTYPFRILWSTMPLSLSDLDYAIDAMRYILTDGQIDSMKSGDRAERRKLFDAYWKAQDPSPGTAYNERQTEYYRRVDFAFFNFRNPVKADDDGMRTARGKIYILFGKPTNVERRLLPDGPAEEIWTYDNNVRKRFIFHDDNKDGTYILAQVTDL